MLNTNTISSLFVAMALHDPGFDLWLTQLYLVLHYQESILLANGTQLSTALLE